MHYDFTVEARGPQGPVETLTYTVDLEVLAGHLVGEHPLKRIEEQLGGIGGRLGSLADAFKRANSGNSRQRGQIDGSTGP
ncbi:hypothetical protein RB200_32125 [Streptomyces sp. PmtG]